MITLQLTPVQYDIVKAAVAAYSDGLMKALEPNGGVLNTLFIPKTQWHSPKVWVDTQDVFQLIGSSDVAISKLEDFVTKA